MKSGFTTVDEYLLTTPEEIRPKLQSLRQAIRKAAPGAEEVISYSMPAYKMNGVLVYFAAFKNHIGFFPTASGVKAFEKKLDGFNTSKGTIQFLFDRPLPIDLIIEIVKFKVNENLEKSASKRSGHIKKSAVQKKNAGIKAATPMKKAAISKKAKPGATHKAKKKA